MWAIPLAVAGIALVVMLNRKVEAAPLYVPTSSAISGAASLPKLDYYYELINTLLFEGYIEQSRYDPLYDAYEERWYELVGV